LIFILHRRFASFFALFSPLRIFFFAAWDSLVLLAIFHTLSPSIQGKQAIGQRRRDIGQKLQSVLETAPAPVVGTNARLLPRVEQYFPTQNLSENYETCHYGNYFRNWTLAQFSAIRTRGFLRATETVSPSPQPAMVEFHF